MCPEVFVHKGSTCTDVHAGRGQFKGERLREDTAQLPHPNNMKSTGKIYAYYQRIL
jgi:hypothetical protein